MSRLVIDSQRKSFSLAYLPPALCHAGRGEEESGGEMDSLYLRQKAFPSFFAVNSSSVGLVIDSSLASSWCSKDSFMTAGQNLESHEKNHYCCQRCIFCSIVPTLWRLTDSHTASLSEVAERMNREKVALLTPRAPKDDDKQTPWRSKRSWTNNNIALVKPAF